MKSTTFLYLGIVVALGACMFSVKGHYHEDVGSLATSNEASNPENILTISPENNKNWVTAEQGVIIEFIFKNNSDKTLTFLAIRGEPQLKFSVTNEKHEAVPLTAFGSIFLSPGENKSPHYRAKQISPYMVTVNPGEKYVRKILLSQLYDMSIPSKYYVTATRDVNLGDESQVIKSNVLEFEVDPYNHGEPTPKDMEYITKQREKQVQEQDKKNNDKNTKE